MDDEKTPDAIVEAMKERRRDPTKRAVSLPEADEMPRPIAWLVLGVAAGCFFMGTYLPISEALDHAAKITAPGKATFVTPILLVLGIYGLIGVERFQRMPVVWGRVLMGLATLVCIGYYQAVRWYLGTLGYTVETSLFS